MLLLGLVVAEVVVFLVLGGLVGFGWTLLAVLLASLVGMVLLRREGLRAWRGFREAAAAGAPPGPRVTDGLVGLFGGLLLAAPGLVSGVAGLLLLTPPVRALARGRLRARAEREMSSAAAGDMFGPRRVHVYQDQQPPPEAAGDEQVVEGEVVDEPGADPRGRGDRG